MELNSSAKASFLDHLDLSQMEKAVLSKRILETDEGFLPSSVSEISPATEYCGIMRMGHRLGLPFPSNWKAIFLSRKKPR